MAEFEYKTTEKFLWQVDPQLDDLRDDDKSNNVGAKKAFARKLSQVDLETPADPDKPVRPKAPGKILLGGDIGAQCELYDVVKGLGVDGLPSPWNEERWPKCAEFKTAEIERKRGELEDYLLENYTGLSGKPEYLDDFELNAFLREKVLHRNEDVTLRDFGYSPPDNIRNLFRGEFRVTPADFLSASETEQATILQICLGNNHFPDELSVDLTLEDILLVVGQLRQSEEVKEPPVKTWTKDIHVGDDTPSDGKESMNTSTTIKNAPSAKPSSTESIVLRPPTGQDKGRVNLHVQSVDYPTTSGPGSEASAIFIYPFSYLDPLPATAESKDKWARANDIKDAAPFFPDIQLKRTTEDDFEVYLPPTAYKVTVQSGRRVKKGGEIDYDNMDVTVTTQAFEIDVALSQLKDETLILGENFEELTRPGPDGKRVAIPGKKARTANAADAEIQLLTSEAYAKYHVNVANPDAPFNKGVKEKIVETGTTYHFSTYVGGVDLRDRVMIENGDETIQIDFSKAGVSYASNQSDVQINDNYSPSGDGIRGRIITDRKSSDFWITEEVMESGVDYVIVKLSEPLEGRSNEYKKQEYVKYAADRDSGGSWFLTTWQSDTLEGPFKFVDQLSVDDKHDAMQRVAAFQEGNIRLLRYPLTANTDRIKITFHSGCVMKKDVPDEPEASETVDCDEVRFDAIRLGTVD